MNAILGSLGCITAFELHFKYDSFVKAACIHAYLCDRIACCLAELHHMITIFGGIGRLRVRPSFVSQLVRIDWLYSLLTLFR